MSDAGYAGAHKVLPFTIQRMTNKTPEFYETVGPFLSRREIVAELGSPVWDDDDKEWFVAVEENGDVQGIVGVRSTEVCSLYVTPAGRGRLIGCALLHQALTSVGAERELRATATERGRELFLLFGFAETGTRGRYYLMRRAAKPEAVDVQPE